MSHNQHIGRQGEMLAAQYVRQLGCQILCTRYRKRGGEVDIVAKDGDCYVFIEVKSRTSVCFGHPAEAVGRAKQQALVMAAQSYLIEQGIQDAPARFDVIEVMLPQEEIHYISNAF